ncbi:unnamed protein product [Cylicostephanus goldi]|uniref:MULE transposase domain-containing protein n=1 Tax=Cylicostephanus goldi TaxID=71465 RepID=A0A3P6UB76_CYLGO|nr:unnamed protein product [Cylicostephanus goldi]
MSALSHQCFAFAAFITVKGRSYLEHYGNRGVVCDDTFNVTKYSFRLATLLVTDDSGNGFPCAHVLSYRMTSAEMENLFQLVKQLVPSFDPQYFMPDDTLTFFNAFKTVFPYSRAKKVLCCFHVLQIFKRKHKELLKAEFLPTAEKLIRAILFDTDKVNFENGFAAYMTWLVNIGASDMLAVRCFDCFGLF